MADLTNSEPKQVVMNLFGAFGKGDMQTIRSLLADDVDWVVTGDPAKMPWAGTFSGPDAVLKLMAGNTGATEDLEIATRWTVSGDDKVISLINERATVGETGRFYDVDSVHVYTVKDGKIVRFENHFNPVPILEATYGDLTYGNGLKKKEYRASEEEWYFFEGDKYHHSEKFLYEYDKDGNRIRGELRNLGRNISYIMSYEYDENGKGIGEEWVNSDDDKDLYVIAYRYDGNSPLVAGGKGVGLSSWDFTYEYDANGRKTRMVNEYSNGNSWVFNFNYNEDGKCILGEGTATSGLRCVMTYVY